MLMFARWVDAFVQTGLGYGKLLHGEAVAIGMHMAADMSCRMGWVDQELVDRSVALMEKAGLPVELPKGGGMNMDKFLNVRGRDITLSWLSMVCGLKVKRCLLVDHDLYVFFVFLFCFGKGIMK